MKKTFKKMRSKLELTVLEAENPLNIVHNNMTTILVVAQIFGIMPVQGVTMKKNLNGVYFTWKSARVFYALFSLFGCFVVSVCCVITLAKDGLRLNNPGTLNFYIFNFFGMWQFFNVARNWPDLLREWAVVEKSMQNYGNPPNLKKHFNIIASTVLGLAFFEHLWFILNTYLSSSKCESFGEHPAENYFRMAFPQVFTLITYSHWKAVLVEFVNIDSTFAWNFTDLFIILISCALAQRFKQLTKRIHKNKVQHANEIFWRVIREDYTKLCNLVDIVDKQISSLVLICFLNNIIFVCLQLYNSLNERVGVVETIYFFGSFVFLVARIFAVLLYAAWINDESRKPLEYLNDVPSEHYCDEISRLVRQIYTYPVGISGSKFFIVSRRFVLTIMGTIVTFELMLLEFGPGRWNRHVNNDIESLNATSNCA